MTDLITLNSFATLTGLTLIVGIVCNAFQKALNFNPKWLALLLSVVLSVVAVFISKTTSQTAASWVDYIVGFFNGFIVYSAAAGANETFSGLTGKKPQPGDGSTAANGGRNEALKGAKASRRFFASWIKK